MARLGGIFITVTSEQPRLQNEVALRAVESGAAITDHVKPLPAVIDIQGVASGPTAALTIRALRAISRSGEPVTYTGRNVFQNVVLEDFISDHTSRVANGFEFTATLRQINIARVRTYELVAPAPPETTTEGGGATAESVKTQTQPTQSVVVLTPEDKPIEEITMAGILSKYTQKSYPVLEESGGGGGGW